MRKKGMIAKIIADRMKRSANVNTYGDLGELLGGISSQAISSAIARDKIPDHWFDIILEKTGVTREELTKPPASVMAALDQRYDVSGAKDGGTTAEESLPMVRNYRQLAAMDTDTLGEIQTWLNDTEALRPGFTSWFRIEFQNRFPEFDEWKNGVIKKRAVNGDPG